MGIADKIGAATGGRNAVYFTWLDEGDDKNPGIYPKVWIEACKEGKNRAGVDNVILEGHILESKVPARPAGTAASIVTSMRFDGSADDVKQYLADIAGIPVAEVDGPTAGELLGEENPLCGTLVSIEATHKFTKAGKDWTNFLIRRLPDDVQANAEAMHAAAGF